MNMFTDEHRSFLCLASFVPWFVAIILVFASRTWDWFDSLCRDVFFSYSDFSPSLPHILCLLTVLSPTFPSLSASFFSFFLLVTYPCHVVAVIHLVLQCWFSQSVVCAIICICNLITDTPQCLQACLSMDLCHSLTSLEILSCVVLNVCVCVWERKYKFWFSDHCFCGYVSGYVGGTVCRFWWSKFKVSEGSKSMFFLFELKQRVSIGITV